MKKIIFFVLFTFCSAVTSAQNLVINPGFESWDKITRPSGWTTAESCSKDSILMVSGAYSCIQACTSATSKCLGQSVSVIPGREYQLSFQYRTSASTTGNGCRIWCYWKNSSGASISDPATDNILRPSKYLKSEIWQQFSITVTAPPEAVTFYLEVRTYPNSSANWDDFVFAEPILNSSEQIIGKQIIVYPNPACRMLYVSNLYKVKRIDIKHSTGTDVYSCVVRDSPQISISLEGFKPGIYILRIICDDELIIRKFVKE